MELQVGSEGRQGAAAKVGVVNAIGQTFGVVEGQDTAGIEVKVVDIVGEVLVLLCKRLE